MTITKKKRSALANLRKSKKSGTSPDCSQSKRRRGPERKAETAAPSFSNANAHYEQDEGNQLGEDSIIDSSQLRDEMAMEAEMGQLLEQEELTEERQEIMRKTRELINWQKELEQKSDELSAREEEIRMLEKEVEERMTKAEELRNELEGIRATMEGSIAESLKNKEVAERMREKVANLRGQMDATKKRFDRLKVQQETHRRSGTVAEKKKISVMAYTECEKTGKEKRLDECLKTIKAAVGIPENDTKFHSIITKVLRDVHEELKVKIKFSIEEELKFINLFSLTQNTRELIKSYFRNHLDYDPFCSNTQIRIQRKKFANEEDWIYKLLSESGGAADGKKGRQAGYTFYNRNIQETVQDHIRCLAESGKLILDAPYLNTVALIFQLDKGGPTTKCGVSVSNLREKVGSPTNFMLLGLSSMSESYECMKEAFDELFEQVSALYGSTISVRINSADVILTIRVKVGGDFKAISMLMGHGGASCKMMCPICETTKPLMKGWDTWKDSVYRTDYLPGEKNISRPPLIPSIQSVDICVPITHVLTGLVKKGMVVLEKKLMGEALDWTDENDDEIKEVSRMFRFATEGLTSIRQFKSKVMEVSKMTITQSNQANGSHSCNKYCLFPTLASDTTFDWDMIACEKCNKAHHVVCTHSWDSELQITRRSDRFICMECAELNVSDLIARDQECIVNLEEQESEALELSMEYDELWKQLSYQESRSPSRLVEELKKMRIDSGVYPRYYYNDLVGSDARRLTMPDNSARLWSLVEDEETRAFGIALFAAIYEIFKLLSTDFQTTEQSLEFGYLVERIKTLWASIHPSETVTLKLHSLSHLRETMVREGFAGREVETIEHVHHCLNTLWPRYATVMPLSHRLFIIVARFNARNSLTY